MRAGTRRAVRALGIVAAVLVIAVGAGVLPPRPPPPGAALEGPGPCRGDPPGPGVSPGAPTLEADPPVWPQSRVVRTAAEAEAAIAEAAAHGADCIKAYSLLSSQALAAIHEAAAKRGL